MDEKTFLHWLVDSNLLPIIGFFSVYLFREIYKDHKYDRIRAKHYEELNCRFLMKGESDLEKFECRFNNEDHARISDNLIINKTNEIFLKEMTLDQGKLVSTLERMTDRIDDIVKEIRVEISLLRASFQRKPRN